MYSFSLMSAHNMFSRLHQQLRGTGTFHTATYNSNSMNRTPANEGIMLCLVESLRILKLVYYEDVRFASQAVLITSNTYFDIYLFHFWYFSFHVYVYEKRVIKPSSSIYESFPYDICLRNVK